MIKMKRILLAIMLFMPFTMAYAESSYDVSEIYSVFKPEAGTKTIFMCKFYSNYLVNWNIFYNFVA